MAPIRLLTFSTLYPSGERPNHGIFVETRLRHLLESGAVTTTVVAPVPWFPSGAARLGSWGSFARTALRETRHGIDVHHPRYAVIPKVGMTLAPWLLYRAMLPFMRRLLATGAGFDAIDAHYLYPDGVAAVWLGKRLGIPVVVTARGTDVSLIPRYAMPRRLIQGAIRDAAALITVSLALKEALVALDAPEAKVTVLRNGVDAALFHPPHDRAAARATLGLTGPTLLSVGLLIDRKGHHRIIEAMPSLPEYTLLIVGEGPERARLAALVERLGVGDRVRLIGARPHADLPAFYGAADALVLASSREGWANVLLEAMACGTPVIASNIWGNPEVVRSPAAGLIMQANSAAGIVAATQRLFASPPDRAATRAYAEAFSWDATTAGQIALFKRVIRSRSRGGPASALNGQLSDH
jgi:glycosyltransferase involved in cell wall biosynthesis